VNLLSSLPVYCGKEVFIYSEGRNIKMVELIKENDEKKFKKALEKALKQYPGANVQYSVSQGTGIGGSAKVIFTALLIIR
jgi:hypothetical protein